MTIRLSVIMLAVTSILGVTAHNADAKGLFNKKKSKKNTAVVAAPDSTKKDSKRNNYKTLLKDAKTQQGMFKVHEVKEKLYFEIPKSIMERDFLLSSRVSSTSNNKDIAAGQMPRNPILISLSADDNNVYFHRKGTRNICDTASSMYESFRRNFLDPMWQAYKIEAMSPDSSAYVIDVTSLFKGDVQELSPFRDANISDALRRKKPMSGSLVSSKSAIVSTKAFDENINIKSRLSYNVGGAPFTCVMTRNMIVLPETPMRSRLADERIGYFYEVRNHFTDDKDGMQRYAIINRWDIRPRPEDVERHKRGEMVEPAKPIVYYVDTAIPEKWRKYIRMGIEDWQQAFEAIGFKNAIIAKDYPKDDPNFDPDDIRYSCYRLVTTPIENSMGPSWVDPRSGEIIQGDVLFYSNIVNLLHHWRFVQTATVDPRVREAVFDDDLMGESLRYVAAHEIGHTLGLMHNFGASYAIPVDSLRSASFTQKYGTTPSIMDYTRYNYVAQPGDKGLRLSPPDLGVYDIYSIMWGYKPIYDAATPEDEKTTLNKWILEKEGDPMYKFTPQPMYASVDPSAQSEDLGNDHVKASTYGIRNLKLIMKNLNEWTREDDNKYERLTNSYVHVVSQFYRYLGHSFTHIGGIYLEEPTRDDGKKVMRFEDKQTQKRNLEFVLTQARETPQWIFEPSVINYTGPIASPSALQYSVLKRLFFRGITASLALYEELEPANAYRYSEYMDDIYNFVWKKSLAGQNPDFYDRSMQIAYVDILLNETGLQKQQKSPLGYTSALAEAEREFMKYETEPLPAVLEAAGARAGFDLNMMAETNMVKDPATYKKLMDTYSLVQRLRNSGNSTTRAHYQAIYFRMKKLMDGK